MRFVEFFLQNLPAFWRGAVITVELTVGGIALGLLIGLLIALMRVSGNRLLGALAWIYAFVIRGTPLLVQIYVVYFVVNLSSAFASGVIALGVNYGAYMSEIIRAAIESIDKGQMEAARSLGMSNGLAMRRVIIPQTYRRLVPPINNEFIAMLKDTSLVSIMALAELTRQGTVIANRTFRTEVYYQVALIYLILTSFFAALGHYLERRAGVHER